MNSWPAFFKRTDRLSSKWHFENVYTSTGNMRVSPYTLAWWNFGRLHQKQPSRNHQRVQALWAIWRCGRGENHLVKIQGLSDYSPPVKEDPNFEDPLKKKQRRNHTQQNSGKKQKVWALYHRDNYCCLIIFSRSFRSLFKSDRPSVFQVALFILSSNRHLPVFHFSQLFSTFSFFSTFFQNLGKIRGGDGSPQNLFCLP